MAYGLKYTSTAYGISSSLWKVELLEKDYTPEEGETPLSLSLVDEGITIGDDREDDRFNVIYSKYAIINFKSTSLFNINTLQFDDEKKYQVKVYKDDVLDFVGWLIPFYSSEDYEDVSISKISVQAKDGINQLKNLNFVDEHPEIASNKQSFKDIICQCLRNVGYNLDTEIYYNKYDSLMDKTSSDCPLAQLYFNISSLEKNDNEYISYYDVLFRLLSVHDLHIKQVEGVWRIVSQVELIDGEVTGRVYDYTGEYLTTNTLSADREISVDGFKIKRGSIIRKDIPFKQFSAFYKADLVVNILPNGKLNQFSGLNPVNWTKVGTWGISEVSTILNSNGIQFDNTYTNSEGLDSKYFESSEIDITGLSSFKFTAEAYADSDIDSIKIAIILYNSTTSAYTYYVDKYGSIKETPVTAIIDKGTEDRYVSFDLSFITNSATQYLNGVDRIKIRIYPGVKLSGGVPTKKKVRYRNLVLTGQSNNYDSEFLGRVYQISNDDLQGSKVADEYEVYYQDNISASVARFRNTLFVGDTSDVTNAWKRTTETQTNTLIESVLIDRLSLCARFNDIFEGEVTGYINNSQTPVLSVEEKRFLILHSEYIVQTNTTEIVMVELVASEVNFSKKIYDRYNDNKVVDVSDSKGSISIKGNEQFDSPLKSTGGTMYGGLYIDFGIDSLPATSTDPRATNKGTLLLGAVNAERITLGNRENDTLVDILGRLGVRNSSNFLGEFSVADLTADRVVSLPDRDIEINKWDDFSGIPTDLAFATGTENYLAKYTSSNNLINSLVFDNGTNVGIGTSTPTFKLDVNGTGRFAGSVQFDAIPTCVVAPTESSHLVNLAHLNSVSFVKKGDNVKTISITTLTKSGLYAVNGYTLLEGDLVLDAGGTAGGGVWVASAGSWSRSTTNDSDSEIRGAYHLITAGDYINQRYINNNTSAITVDTTAITYTLDFGQESDPVWSAYKTANDLTPTRFGNWNTAYGWGNHAGLYVDKTSAQSDIAGAKKFTTSIQSPIVKGGTDSLGITISNYFGTAPRVASSSSLDFFSTGNFTWFTTGDLGRMKLTTTGLRVGSSTNPDFTLQVSGTTGLGGLLSVVSPITGTYSSGTEGQVLMRRSVSSLNYNAWTSLTVSHISDISTAYQAKITGTTNYLIKKTSTSVGDSLVYDDGTNVVIGDTNPIDSAKFSVVGKIGASTLRVGDNTDGINIGSLAINSTGALAYGATSHTWNISSTEKLNLNSSRLALTGDFELTGKIKVAGSFGADHYFLKSNGTTQEWAIMNVGEIDDIYDLFASKEYADLNYVKRVTDQGERGFFLYGDADNTVKEAFIFSNPDTGIIGIHAFRLNNTTVEQFGFQLDKNGFPYWLFADGSRKRILTENDSVGGGGVLGGVVSSDLTFGVQRNMFWRSPSITDPTSYAAKLFWQGSGTYTSPIFTAVNGMVFEAETAINIGTTTDLNLKGNKIYFNGIEIDMSTFANGRYLRATSSTKAEWVV